MRKVFGKGINFSAQINSSRNNIHTFEPIQELSHSFIKNLDCGYLQSFYLLDNGQVLKIGNLMDSLVNIRQLKFYKNASFLFKALQKMSFLGKTLSLKGGHSRLTVINMQMLINQIKPVDIEFGISRIFLKDNKNNYYGLGQNYFGQLGTQDCITFDHVFRRIQNPKNQSIKTIKCGFQHTVFLTESGNLYGCGKADSFQIQPMNFQTRQTTTGITDKILQPSLIWKGNVKHVACGFKHTVFSCGENYLYALGNNKFGQCGQNIKQKPEVSKPQKIYFPLRKSQTIINIKCGFCHTLVLTNEGLYFFGSKEQNQNPFQKFNDNLSSPSKIKLNFQVEKIFTNFDRTAIIGKTGECLIFGGNSLQKFGGSSGLVQDLSKDYDWNKDSLIGLGFGHTIICP